RAGESTSDDIRVASVALLTVAGRREYASPDGFPAISLPSEKCVLRESAYIICGLSTHSTGEFIHGHFHGNKPAQSGTRFQYPQRLSTNRSAESGNRIGYLHGHRGRREYHGFACREDRRRGTRCPHPLRLPDHPWVSG